MSVRDHTVRRRPPRVRWVLTAMLSFTAGFACAASLFAYTSRIPIPLKVTPTRAVDDLINQARDDDSPIGDLQFQEHLQGRVIATINAPQGTPAPAPAPRELQVVGGEAVAQPSAGVEAAALASFVQAGAFNDLASASRLQETLAGQGLPAEVRTNEAGDLHRVVIGPYAKPGDAETVRAQLALQGRTTQMLRLPAR